MLFMLGLLTNRDNALGVVCFVCSCCLLIFLMSSESQGPPERPKARPHRCNARVEDLLQVRPAAYCCVTGSTHKGYDPQLAADECLLFLSRVYCSAQALFTLEFGVKVRPAWRNVRECLKSELG